MNQQTLLLVALRERQENGFMTINTRRALNDIGMTAAQIESALINMENRSGS